MSGIERASRIGRWRVMGLVPMMLCATGEPSLSADRPSDALTPEFIRMQPLFADVPLARGSFLGYESAIRIGLERHPLLKRSKETALAAQAVSAQAAARYYPELNAYAIQGNRASAQRLQCGRRTEQADLLCRKRRSAGGPIDL